MYFSVFTSVFVGSQGVVGMLAEEQLVNEENSPKWHQQLVVNMCVHTSSCHLVTLPNTTTNTNTEGGNGRGLREVAIAGDYPTLDIL